MSRPSRTFRCESCGTSFEVAEHHLTRYSGWSPKRCLRCRGKRSDSAGASSRAVTPKGRKKGASRELNLTVAQVLERFTEGPASGVFTDGACSGNPGPGGWGVVWVEDGEVREQRHGHADGTTNNRMELTALLEAYRMLPESAEVTVWSDSQLCVKTLNEWAAGWARRGWKRKTGPIANLDLVRPLYELHRRHPGVRLRWIAAHDGSRWNEYADSLATAHQRSEL